MYQKVEKESLYSLPYNLWVFATELPDDIELNLLYAGEGTFWTDLKGLTETLVARQAKESSPKKTPPPRTQPRSDSR